MAYNCMYFFFFAGGMISALDSGARAPGSSPGREHCVVFLGKTLYSHGVSLRLLAVCFSLEISAEIRHYLAQRKMGRDVGAARTRRKTDCRLLSCF